MSTIKTAISIDKELYKEVEKISKETHLSRSQIFSQAVEYVIKQKENLILFEKLNEVYGPKPTSKEKKQQKGAQKKFSRLVKGTWK